MRNKCLKELIRTTLITGVFEKHCLKSKYTLHNLGRLAYIVRRGRLKLEIPFNIIFDVRPTILCALLSLETQKGHQLNLAFEDSSLKAVFIID